MPSSYRHAHFNGQIKLALRAPPPFLVKGGVRLTDAAEADIAEIWTYLGTRSSEEVTTRFVREIEAALAERGGFSE